MAAGGKEIEVAPQWRELADAMGDGTFLVLGGPDSGKTTLVRHLVKTRRAGGDRVGWLDADPGQSALGVPASLHLSLRDRPGGEPEVAAAFFIGSTSPRGHMLPVLTGLHHLERIACQSGCQALVVDTSGLVDPTAGGGALKEWKIELLRPRAVIALRRAGELDHLLQPLRRERRLTLHELPVPNAVRRRSPEERRARRQERFRRFFEGAGSLRLPLDEVPVYGLEKVEAGRLLALIDQRGLTRSLGLVDGCKNGVLDLSTPVPDLRDVAAVRIGSVTVDRASGEES